MDNYKDHTENNLTVNDNLGDALQSSVASIANVFADYQIQTLTSTFNYMQEVLKDFAQYMTRICIESIDFGVLNDVIKEIIEINIYPLVNQSVFSETLQETVKALGTSFYYRDGIQALSTSFSELRSSYEDMLSEISSISEADLEVLLEGTDYTRDEILDDIKLFKEEICGEVVANNLGEDGKIYLQRKIDEFLKKHPAIAHVLYCIYLAITIASGIQVTEEMLLPLAQDAIVSLRGCEDIFFVKVGSAKLYTEPSSHSDVITKILYAEQVTQIESVKLWDKVIYINPDGEEVEGWIAKRNLMTYQDYEFNSEDLYNLD